MADKPNGRLLVEDGISAARASICNVLRSLVRNNIDHFHDDTSAVGARFHEAFSKMDRDLDDVQPLAEKLRRIAPEYDFDAETTGNGYRSFIAVVDACVLQCIRLCRYICLKRSSFLFRSNNYCCEVEAYTAMMGSLKVDLQHLETLSIWSEKGSLFPNDEHSLDELLLEAEKVDQYCFYGRCLGFQFCESMQKPLLAVSILMASFSEVYYSSGSGVLARTASSLFNCGRYVLSPEERARRVVNVAQRASVDFCKAFWLLQETEVLKQLPAYICPQVAVNKVFTILPEPMEVPKYDDDEMVDIPIPMSHIGAASMYCRLLSANRREGQPIELTEQEDKMTCHIPMEPTCPGLVIHCHGGGFVAQSSKSHEVYLRDWARQLNVPILCIDYSLAPLAPYPRALEECLYIYVWALKNSLRLGSTADRVIFVGDSAGGNLVFAVAMKAIQLGIRKPDAIFALYTPMFIDFVPSPSRLLCLMDPLLPFGFMLRCLKAYVGPSINDQGMEYKPGQGVDQEKMNGEANKEVNPFKKPSSRTKDLPDAVASANEFVDAVGEPAIGRNVGGDTLSPLLHAITELEQTESSEWKEAALLAVLDADEKSAELINNSSKPSQHDDDDDDKTSPPLPAAMVVAQMEEKAGSKTSSLMQTVSLTSEDGFQTPVGEEYASDFIGRVPVLSQEGSDSEENILFEMPIDLSMGISSRLSTMTGKVVKGITKLLPASRSQSTSPRGASLAALGSPGSGGTSSSGGGSLLEEPLDAARYCSEEFKKFKVNKDPYLSPYLASDEMLLKLPHVSFLSLQLDPCLDDSIMFCKRLKALGRRPHITILDKLPHGFLSFSLVSRDAYDGSRICVKELKRLLALDEESAEPNNAM